jgi:hypothetical protein
MDVRENKTLPTETLITKNNMLRNNTSQSSITLVIGNNDWNQAKRQIVPLSSIAGFCLSYCLYAYSLHSWQGKESNILVNLKLGAVGGCKIPKTVLFFSSCQGQNGENGREVFSHKVCLIYLLSVFIIFPLRRVIYWQA